LQSRKPLGKFELDTSFSVVDAEADNKWIVAEISSTQTENSNVLFDVARTMPFSNAAVSWSQWALGMMMGAESPGIGLKLDFTPMFEKLKANVLQLVKDTNFQVTLDALEGTQNTWADYFGQMHHLAKDEETLISILAGLLQKLHQAYEVHLKKDCEDEYAFFLIEPLFRHIFMYYTTSDLIVATVLDLKRDQCALLPLLRQQLKEMICGLPDLFERGSRQRYKATLVRSVKGWTQCYLSDQQCKTWKKQYGHMGKPLGSKCEKYDYWNTVKATYAWGDAWLAMPEFRESWKVEVRSKDFRNRDHNYVKWDGVACSGKELKEDVKKYRSEAKDTLSRWYRETMKTVLDFVNEMDKLMEEHGCTSETSETTHLTPKGRAIMGINDTEWTDTECAQSFDLQLIERVLNEID